MLRRSSGPARTRSDSSTDPGTDPGTGTALTGDAGVPRTGTHRARRRSGSGLAGAHALRVGAAVAVLGGATVAGTSLLHGPLDESAAAQGMPRAAQAALVDGVLADGGQRQDAAATAAQQATRAAAAKAAADRAAAAKAAAEKAAAQRAAAARVAQARAERRAEAARAARSAARDPKSAARAMLASHGWSSGQFSCLNSLWTKESGWKVHADNPSSSAYGIPQALPGGKMASAGPDWRTNPVTQIRWGLNYIADSYGSPCAAWAHSQANNWY